MSIQSRIETLQARHSNLEQQLEELKGTVSVSDADIRRLKQEKLSLKDRISSLAKAG